VRQSIQIKILFIAFITLACLSIVLSSILKRRPQRQISSFATDLTKKIDGSSFIGANFIDFSLEDLNGRVYSLDEIDASIRIIISFKTDDCASCLAEYRFWSKISSTFPPDEIFIIGISSSSIENIFSFSKSRRLNFPILHDPLHIVSDSMGFRFSPLRITLNRENKILDVSLPSGEFAKQKKYLSNLTNWKDGSNER
jgi:peroxiredoxin